MSRGWCDDNAGCSASWVRDLISSCANAAEARAAGLLGLGGPKPRRRRVLDELVVLPGDQLPADRAREHGKAGEDISSWPWEDVEPVGARVVVRPSGTEPTLKGYLEVVAPVAGELEATPEAARATLRAAVAETLRL